MGKVPVVVDGVVVDVAKDGPGAEPVRAVLAVDVLAQLVHHLIRKNSVKITGVQAPDPVG